MNENAQQIVEEENLRIAVRKHDPKTVTIVSLFLGGAGHLQMGSVVAGIIMLLISFCLWAFVPFTFGAGLILLIPWNSLCAFLAYRKAMKFQSIHGL